MQGQGRDEEALWGIWTSALTAMVICGGYRRTWAALVDADAADGRFIMPVEQPRALAVKSEDEPRHRRKIRLKRVGQQG